MSDNDASRQQEILRGLESLGARMRRLVVAVVLMALALFLTVSVVFGYLVEFHAGEALLRGAVAASAAIVGFGFGFFAGRRR